MKIDLSPATYRGPLIEGYVATLAVVSTQKPNCCAHLNTIMQQLDSSLQASAPRYSRPCATCTVSVALMTAYCQRTVQQHVKETAAPYTLMQQRALLRTKGEQWTEL
jgi:hypothetical protein